jgi:hypothetical protein
MAKINTILQCFVDLNLELDENAVYSLDLREVSFEQPRYDVIESGQIDVVILLDSPSENGLEEIDINIVANNTSLSDVNFLGEVYPQTIAFSAGQQSHTLSFSANIDLFEEGTESFDIIISYFTNTNPGQFITTTVNIIDQTDLKEVFINEQGGVLSSQDTGVVEFSALEGSEKKIRISLDSPSVLGVESVDLLLTNITTSPGDYLGAVGTTNISWTPGEQHKDIQIFANADDEIEDSEVLKIELINPVNLNIISPSEATLTILDSSPEPLYANINIQGTYVQWGGEGYPTIEGRYIRENVAGTSYETPQNERRFIKFGEPLEKSYTQFNEPNGQSQGFGFDAGNNVIVGYDESLFGNLQKTNVVFFGERPSISFGPGTSWSVNPGTPEYGDLRLRIRNAGAFPVIIDGNAVASGDSITVVVDKFDYNITLPANSGFLQASTFYNGVLLSQDTLTECIYEFIFEVDFEELNFQLRNESNSVSPNKEISIGTHVFVETYTQTDSELPQNRHNLITGVKNVWPFWESQFSFPNNSAYCIAGGNMSNLSPNYPTTNTDLQSVLFDGIPFLYQDSTTENNTSTTKTSYQNFYFLPSGQTAASSGCTGVNIEYPPILGTNAPYTVSMPFFVLDQ